ncbi:MAG: HAD-IB family phosphatase, partial [Labilibaculum sp.]|nr:HAD-IB family phosphatase [Labilibaculum sp.]
LVKIYFFKVIGRLYPKNNWHKKLKLSQIQGMSYVDICKLSKDYYHEVVRPNILTPIIKELLNRKDENYITVVVSGGYSIYIKHFCEEFDVDHLVATDIKFSNNKCEGKISGLDCMNYNKLKKLSLEINISNEELKGSISYSDNISDLPLLKLTDMGVVVSKNKSQNWAKLNNLNEIIWKNH